MILKMDPNSSIKNVNKLKDNLLMNIETGAEEIILDFSDLKRSDLSIMQLLLFIQDYCKNYDSVLKLKNVSSELKIQLVICGLLK